MAVKGNTGWNFCKGRKKNRGSGGELGESPRSNTTAGLALHGPSTTTTIVIKRASPADVIEDFLCSRHTTLGALCELTHLSVTEEVSYWKLEVDVHGWNNQRLTF